MFATRPIPSSIVISRSHSISFALSMSLSPAPSIPFQPHLFLCFSVPFYLVLWLYHLSVSLVIFIFLSLYLNLCLSFPLILYYFHSPYIFFSAVFRNRFMCRNVPPSFCKCRIAQANATIFRQLPPSFWVCRSTQATQQPSKMSPVYV